MKVRQLLGKPKTVLIHALVWAVILSIPYIYVGGHEGGHEVGRHKEIFDRSIFQTFDFITNFFWIAVFYINSEILVPAFMFRRRYYGYAVSLLLLFLLLFLLHNLLFLSMYYPQRLMLIGALRHNLVPFFFTITLSATYKAINDRIQSENHQKDKQNENLKTELSFLRSQISPHFLFNVLNNIVAMARLKSEELEPTIVKLSALLQYMLYENGDEKVLLRDEIESLHNYIDLQLLRMDSRLLLHLNLDLKDDWHSIEPMLLMPFVENAFKHGNLFQRNPEISIILTVEDKVLHFKVRNRYQENDQAKDKVSGIGLVNVRRRLALLYPGKHELLISTVGGWFDVHLKLTLQ